MKLLRYDRGQFAATALVKGYFSVGGGEKGVIASAAHVRTRVDFGPALAGYDGAGFDNGAVSRFYSQIFGI
jgi:hypothetical protein